MLRDQRGEFSIGAFLLLIGVIAVLGILFYLYGYPKMHSYTGPQKSPLESDTDQIDTNDVIEDDFGNPPPTAP